MKRLRMPRASRPLNARVSAVGASDASASRCACDVPASGARMNAVPTWAARAPSASTAWTAAAVAIPPVATSGHVDVDQLQQRVQADRLEVGRVDPRAAVAAGLGALDDERARARFHGARAPLPGW